VIKVSHLNLNIYTLAVTNFLWGFVNFVFMIQIQPYLVSIYKTNDAVAQILGLIISFGSLAAVIPLVLGFLSDLYGRKKNIIFGQILSILGLLGLVTGITDVLLLLPSIILFNLGIGLYDAPLQGLIYESSTRNRGLAFSFIYNSSYLSGITASFLLRVGDKDFTFFFQLGLFLILVSLLINICLLHDIKPNVKKLDFPLIRILKNPTSRLIAFTFAIDAFIWGLPLSIANTIYILVFKVDLSFIATLTLVETIIMVLLAYPAGIFVDRFGRIAGLIVGEILGIIWIILVFAAFFILANIPLFGLSENALSRFEYLAIILGTDFGSIISLGIGPIVMASIILQLLVGSGIININTNTYRNQNTVDFYMFLCNKIVDLNGNNALDDWDNEVFGLNKKVYNINKEDVTCAIYNSTPGNVLVQSWTEDGRLVGETNLVFTETKKAHGRRTCPDCSIGGDFMDEIKGAGPGNYRITATSEDGRIRAVSLRITD